VVTATENRFPDQLALNPQENFVERLNTLTPQLEQQGVSLQNIRTGNYVVLDHLNGEYSYYCHLRQNILVRPGEKVKKGQVLARVGNSGNSSEPHLHFQLMDDGDFAVANGLPVVFEDINLETSLDSAFFGDRNCLLYSEFIFTFTN
jgi:murein DD-endopeptidase MepM/ murein hydrolase activator NlpD